MKKTVILLTLLVAVAAGLTCVWAAEYTKFSSNLLKILKIVMLIKKQQPSSLRVKHSLQTEKFLAGEMVFCKYQETISSTDGKYQLNCSFSSIQVDELYESMKNRSKEPERYDLEMFAEEKGPNGQHQICKQRYNYD